MTLNFVETCNARADLEIPNFRQNVKGLSPSIFDENFFRTRTDFPHFGYVTCETSFADPFFMLDNNDDAVAKHWYWYGRDGYEPTSVREWCVRARRSRVVFDIGAHTGAFSMLAMRSNPGITSVSSFEPTARAYSRLVENMIVNSMLDRVKPERLAVSNVESSIDFNVFDDLYQIGTGNSYKTEHTSFTVRSHEACQATTIDGYIERTGLVPDLVKLDVEGAELDALAGAGNLLAARKTMFLVEVTPGSMPAVAQLFANYRISIVDDEHNRLLAYRGQSIDHFANVIVDPE